MVFCTIAFSIVKDDWQTVARALAQFHIALDNGFENQFLEMSLYLIVNLIGKAKTAIVHCQQEAFDF